MFDQENIYRVSVYKRNINGIVDIKTKSFASHLHSEFFLFFVKGKLFQREVVALIHPFCSSSNPPTNSRGRVKGQQIGKGYGRKEHHPTHRR